MLPVLPSRLAAAPALRVELYAALVVVEYSRSPPDSWPGLKRLTAGCATGWERRDTG